MIEVPDWSSSADICSTDSVPKLKHNDNNYIIVITHNFPVIYYI